ncbi:MAG: fasciclin domain-containing protein [Candidatus Promineifilaceae bacterium]|jgi:transforming growth factor-beta-induced protein
MHQTNLFSRKHILLVIVTVLALSLMAIPALAKGDKAPGDATIYDIASSSPDFSTLAFALEATGLDAALDNGGQFTVFAPTNAAFEKLEAENPGTIAYLVANPEVLESVLLYHVTDGRRWSNSLVNKNNPKDVEMLSGGMITVTPSGMIMDTDSLGLMSPDATIVAANVNASNGVIHVIDEVLIP